MTNLQGERVIVDREGKEYLLKSKLVWEKIEKLPEGFEGYNLILTNWISAYVEREGQTYKAWWYEEDRFGEEDGLEEYEAVYIEELK